MKWHYIFAKLGHRLLKYQRLTAHTHPATVEDQFDEMQRGLIDFGRQARGADMAVVFFAGHGMEIGGENWLSQSMPS
jgi:hypothetical protein